MRLGLSFHRVVISTVSLEDWTDRKEGDHDSVVEIARKTGRIWGILVLYGTSGPGRRGWKSRVEVLGVVTVLGRGVLLPKWTGH